MRAQNAAALSSEGDRREGRGTKHRTGKRDPQFLAEKSPISQAGLPDTPMAHAFLRALRNWLSRRSDKSSRQIAIPTGVVSDAELAQVLLAIFKLKPGQAARDPSRWQA